MILSYKEEYRRAKGLKPVPVPDQILRGVIVLAIAGLIGLTWRYVISLGGTAYTALQIAFTCFQFGLIAWLVIGFIRRRSPSVQIPKRLKRGECPGCLYDLAGLPPERVETIERAVRCPECGAVWKAERVGPSAAGM